MGMTRKTPPRRPTCKTSQDQQRRHARNAVLGARKRPPKTAGKAKGSLRTLYPPIEPNASGHTNNHAKVDHSVGVSEIKKVGTQVKQGEPLMMIHYNDEAKLEQALEYFKNAYRLAPKRPTPPPLIVERVA